MHPKNLVDQVEFILLNGVARKQPVVYEFTPKFCSTCNCFGHLKDSCKGTQLSAAAAATAPATTVRPIAPKKVQPTEWNVVQRWNKNYQKHQHPVKGVQQSDTPAANNDEQGR
ncbi:UNVERIFIED_CONTAM: hypothetical protein Slati_0077700 [Sesamum latifolium]|uniref:Zinc knuckle CX2CX4HX4C domain-containing protein n=1 Tax=Sesamum latifolium TaxID=2727402 RepID=A0AAW2Y8C9_9LAMI